MSKKYYFFWQLEKSDHFIFKFIALPVWQHCLLALGLLFIIFTYPIYHYIQTNHSLQKQQKLNQEMSENINKQQQLLNQIEANKLQLVQTSQLQKAQLNQQFELFFLNFPELVFDSPQWSIEQAIQVELSILGEFNHLLSFIEQFIPHFHLIKVRSIQFNHPEEQLATQLVLNLSINTEETK